MPSRFDHQESIQQLLFCMFIEYSLQLVVHRILRAGEHPQENDSSAHPCDEYETAKILVSSNENPFVRLGCLQQHSILPLRQPQFRSRHHIVSKSPKKSDRNAIDILVGEEPHAEFFDK